MKFFLNQGTTIYRDASNVVTGLREECFSFKQYL